MPWVKGQSGNPGGRPSLPIEIREVRKLCQEKSKRAFEIVAGLMEDAEKDAVRLAAALAVLKMAGMPMSADVTIEVQPAAARPLPDRSSEELEAGLGPEGTVQ
jgi:hypothetical protein